MRPEGARPAFTKAGPAGWALDEGNRLGCSARFSPSQRFDSTPLESHSSPFSLRFFLMLFSFLFLLFNVS